MSQAAYACETALSDWVTEIKVGISKDGASNNSLDIIIDAKHG
jgi:hypothetical protein